MTVFAPDALGMVYVTRSGLKRAHIQRPDDDIPSDPFRALGRMHRGRRAYTFCGREMSGDWMSAPDSLDRCDRCVRGEFAAE